MIGRLTGQVVHKQDDTVILDVSGVGYEVTLLHSDAEIAEGNLGVYTYLAVRETALDLYGFVEKKSKDFFTLLISINGIGPKAALSILNHADPDTLAQAALGNDASVLTKVSGIGAKTAQKIVLELQSKLEKMDYTLGATLGEGTAVQTFEALEALGFAHQQIKQVLKDPSLEGLDGDGQLRQALKLLGR